jgi:hypothetical protein
VYRAKDADGNDIVALDALTPGAAKVSLWRFVPHVGIPLVATFKALSVGITELPIFVAAQTASGLRPGEWTRRLLEVLEAYGIFNLALPDRG